MPTHVGSRAWTLQPYEPEAILTKESEKHTFKARGREVSAEPGTEEAFSRDGFAAWGSRAGPSHTRGRR